MTHPLPTYLRTIRKRHALTQAELGLLLGYSTSAISKFETRSSPPTVKLILGCEVIFGGGARELFPAVYRDIEDEVMRRARGLYERLEKRNDLASLDKMQLLLDMIHRVEGDSFQV